ncbi:MAG: PAS domain S-box protein [Desulfomonilaceae bacterium]|nr:PAS domain S-box protein [Desulfomonilaceae bacterium]
MSSQNLLWIGRSDSVSLTLQEALHSESDSLVITTAPDGVSALEILAAQPRHHLIVVIDLKPTGMDLKSLITGIKQINPEIEIIVIGDHGLSWSSLNLPRYYRPVLLSHTSGSDPLISCVAKLREVVEAREDYAQLTQRVAGNMAMARKSTEALLALLHRQDSVGMISIRRDGFFVACNAEAQRITGYSVEELAHIQAWVQNLLPDADSIGSFLCAIEDAWANKLGRKELRVRIKRSDNHVVTLSMTLLVLPDELGQARQIVSLFYDPYESLQSREYQVLYQSSVLGLYTYLPAKGFLRISDTALSLVNQALGLSLDLADVIGRKITDLPFPPEVALRWRHTLEGVAGGAGRGEEALPPVGTPGRPAIVHLVMDRVDAGSAENIAVIAVVGAGREEHPGTADTVSTETISAKTLNSIPHPLILMRPVRVAQGAVADFRCTAMNPAAGKLLGLNEKFQSGRCLPEIFVDDEARDQLLGYACEALDTGKYGEFEIRFRLRAEDPDRVLLRCRLCRIGDGVCFLFQDVTAMRREERHLNQYRHVFSHMDEAIIVTDLDGNIIDWNPASERMFGYRKEQILGQPAHILTQNTTGDQLEQTSRDVLRDGDVWKGEYEFVRGDQSLGVAFSVFALLKDDLGTPYGTVGLCHDLTERKRLEERLTAKSQELRDKNTALSTLLRHAEEERVRACEQVVMDLTQRITERVYRVLESKNKPNLVESHAKLMLQELMGGAAREKEPDLEDPSLKLSEKEREVAQLIRLGKTTDEIAFILEKSPDTIRLQRISIRRKLGLTRRDRNLAAYLRKIDIA